MLGHTDKYNLIIQDYKDIRFSDNASAEIDIYSPRARFSHMFRVCDDTIADNAYRFSEYRLVSNTVYIITTNLKSIQQIRSLVRGYQLC